MMPPTVTTMTLMTTGGPINGITTNGNTTCRAEKSEATVSLAGGRGEITVRMIYDGQLRRGASRL